MMSSLQFAVFWCVVQVVVLSLIGLFVTHRWIARHPRAASRLATGAVVAVIMVTISIPLRLSWSPEWITPAPGVDSHPAAVEAPAATSRPSDIADSSRPMMWNVRSLLNRLHELQDISATERFAWTKWAMLGLMIASWVGLLNVLVTLLSIQRIRRRSHPITNPQIDELVTSIRSYYGIRKPVLVVESDVVDCAAVVGVFRPVVVLSRTWPQWSLGEQQAVLSHELAHIRQGDVFVRLIAMIGVSLHLYNPVLRWVSQQLVLAQELAVDQLAMPIAGGSANYIWTLSGLLLRIDAGTAVRSPSWVMPVFSGDWIRRIKMLRTMDGAATHQSRGWSRLAMGLIAVLAIGSTALRVLAQGEARPSGDFESSETSSSEAESTGGKLFQRPKIPAQQIVFADDKGGFQVNFAELRKCSGFGHLVQTALEFQLTAATVHRWDLSSLDLLVSNATMQLNSTPNETEKHSLMIAFTKTLVRTNRDVDWNNLVRTFLPDAKERPDLGTRILEAVIPALGPQIRLIQPLSPRELVFEGDAIDSKGPVTTPAWAQEWNSVSGGVMTVLMPFRNLDQFPDFAAEPGGEHLNVLTHGVDQLAFGIDVGESDHSLEVRARLHCRDQLQVAKVRNAIHGVVDFSIQEMNQGVDQTPLSLEQKVYKDLLASLRFIEVADAPQVVECRFSCAFPKDMLDRINRELDEVMATSLKAIQQASDQLPEKR